MLSMLHTAHPGAFGVITHPKGVRIGINEYLKGFLREENVRIRTEAIRFDVHAPQATKEVTSLMKFEQFTNKYEGGF